MDIRKDYTIAAARDAVWAAMTDPAVIERWGGGPATMSAVPGSEFSLWGGEARGTVTAADPGRSLTLDWDSGDWGGATVVRFTLGNEPDARTRVELLQTGVPDAVAADVAAAWDDDYFSPLARLFDEGEAWA